MGETRLIPYFRDKSGDIFGRRESSYAGSFGCARLTKAKMKCRYLLSEVNSAGYYFISNEEQMIVNRDQLSDRLKLIAYCFS